VYHIPERIPDSETEAGMEGTQHPTNPMPPACHTIAPPRAPAVEASCRERACLPNDESQVRAVGSSAGAA
jgi:hypothetical protein